MPKNKPLHLSEIIAPLAPEGANDKRWFLVEHQLEQICQSAQITVGWLRLIADNPESEQEREIATDCLDIIKGMWTDIQEHDCTFLAYISGTDVPDKISRKEV